MTAKGLASGFPLSAIAARAGLMSPARPGSHVGMYGGNAVACSAALATLDVIRDEKLVADAAPWPASWWPSAEPGNGHRAGRRGHRCART